MLTRHGRRQNTQTNENTAVDPEILNYLSKSTVITDSLLHWRVYNDNGYQDGIGRHGKKRSTGQLRNVAHHAERDHDHERSDRHDNFAFHKCVTQTQYSGDLQ